MSKNIRVVFVLLTIVLIFFSYMIFRFYKNVEVAVMTNDPAFSAPSGIPSGLSVFRDDSGLKGIKNENGQIIIPARWSGISAAAPGQFVVSLTDGQESRAGVIGISENTVIPVSYRRVAYDQYDDLYICTTEKGRFVIFDGNGKALIEREWDSCQKKIQDRPLESEGNYLELHCMDDVYRIRSRDGKLSVMYIKMVRELCGEEKQITIRNADRNISLRDIPDYYGQVVDSSIDYIVSMFSGDAARIKKLVSENGFEGPDAEQVDFRGGELRYFDAIWPFIENKDGVLSYSCKISLMYSVPDRMNFDGSYTKSYKAVIFNIRMRREQDGFLRIFSVKADNADLSDFDIPDSCFDPPDPPEAPDVTEVSGETESDEPETAVTEVTEVPYETSVTGYTKKND